VFRAMNGRSGPRVGTMQFHGGGAGYRYPIGYDSYLMYVAMWAQRFLHETGQDELDLAAVAIEQRAHAARNPAAMRREPLELDGTLPVNTNGGLLAEGYLHGMNTVVEAARQVQGRAGDGQAPHHDVVAVTSGALMDGSAMILTIDR